MSSTIPRVHRSHVLEDRFGEGLFGWKVEVESAFGGCGVGDDVVDRRAGVAAVGELVRGRGED
jgi:hypothetical protein